MKVKLNNSLALRILFPACLIALSGVLGLAGHVAAQTKAKAGVTTVKQKSFATSQEAASALIKAAGEFDVPTLQAILGPHGADMVVTADTAQDKERADVCS